jgi:hypothetical protein
MLRIDAANAWRYMSFLGGLPAVLSVIVVTKVCRKGGGKLRGARSRSHNGHSVDRPPV